MLHLHPRIEKASRRQFLDGHYSDAIFNAFRAIEVSVKEKTGVSRLIGQDLMAKVFRLDHPILKINPLAKDVDMDEQEGFKFLFMGAMRGIKNPKSHDEIVQKDPFRTLQYLAFASLLAKRVEESKMVSLNRR